MVVDSLADVKAAFDGWRGGKSHVREAIPVPLLERARAAARRYGPVAVSRVTKVGRARLSAGSGDRGRKAAPAERVPVPSYSRLEMQAPAATMRPFAELEMSTGLKVRLFTQTDEILALVSSLCGNRGTP